MIIEKISENVVKYLVSSDEIENDDISKEFYQYGVEITISSILNFALVSFFGIITGHFADSVIFLFLLVLLRRFTGGYHASTYFGCNATCCITFLGIILLEEVSLLFDISKHIAMLLGILSVFVIAIKCPIENPNKPIPKNRNKTYKTISIALSLTYLIGGFCLLGNNIKYGYLVLYTLLIVAMFVMINKRKEDSK